MLESLRKLPTVCPGLMKQCASIAEHSVIPTTAIVFKWTDQVLA